MNKETTTTHYKTITAIEEYDLKQSNLDNEIRVFLAGGICQCDNWQQTVIRHITTQAIDNNDIPKLILFNPRRDVFPIDNPNESYKQIEWEFKWMKEMNIFSMYFDASTSAQPICFYELGRYLVLMMQKYPDDYQNRIVISYKEGFIRIKDVEIQTSLATKGNVKVKQCKNSIEHAELILEAYICLIHNN